MKLHQVGGHVINPDAIAFIQPDGNNRAIIHFIGGETLLLDGGYQQLLNDLKSLK